MQGPESQNIRVAVRKFRTREKGDNSDDFGSSIFAPPRFPAALPAVRSIRKYSTLSPCSISMRKFGTVISCASKLRMLLAGLSMACTPGRRDLEATIRAGLSAEVLRHRHLMCAQLGFFMPGHPGTPEIPGKQGDEEILKTPLRKA